MTLKWFTPLKGEPHQRRFVAFDVEGVGGGQGFWCGAAVSDQGQAYFTTADDLWQYLKDEQHEDAWRVAHNLEYDLSVLAIEALLSEGSIMGPTGLLWYDTLDSSGSAARFVDSARLFRDYSIRALGELVQLPKLPTPTEAFNACRSGVNAADLPGDLRDQLRAYNMRDAEILFRALQLLQSEVNALGGQLRETIAGTAHDTYRRSYMPHAWKTVGEKTNAIARAAYYGGRNEALFMGWNRGVNLYDANSLYPAKLASEPFPDTRYLDLEVRDTLPDDLDEREGVCQCVVEVPPMPIPPLPARVGGGLFFPVGTWRAAFCLNELRYALSLGVKVQRVDWLLSSRMTFNPFTAFIGDLYQRRAELQAAGSSAEHVVKLLMNATVGRFGVDFSSPLATLEIIRTRFDPERDRGLIWNTLCGYDYIERPLPDRGIPAYANVFIPAQVAAAARITLHQALSAHGDRAVYCDTDSLMTRGQLETGSGLGDWKTELEGGDAWLIGPKEYAVLRDYEVAQVRAKGVPHRLALQYLQIGAVRYDMALSIRQAKARGQWPGQWVETVRARRDPTPKRRPLENLSHSPDAVATVPWHLSELMAHYDLYLSHLRSERDAQPL